MTLLAVFFCENITECEGEEFEPVSIKHK